MSVGETIVFNGRKCTKVRRSRLTRPPSNDGFRSSDIVPPATSNTGTPLQDDVPPINVPNPPSPTPSEGAGSRGISGNGGMNQDTVVIIVAAIVAVIAAVGLVLVVLFFRRRLRGISDAAVMHAQPEMTESGGQSPTRSAPTPPSTFRYSGSTAADIDPAWIAYIQAGRAGPPPQTAARRVRRSSPSPPAQAARGTGSVGREPLDPFSDNQSDTTIQHSVLYTSASHRASTIPSQDGRDRSPSSTWRLSNSSRSDRSSSSRGATYSPTPLGAVDPPRSVVRYLVEGVIPSPSLHIFSDRSPAGTSARGSEVSSGQRRAVGSSSNSLEPPPSNPFEPEGGDSVASSVVSSRVNSWSHNSDIEDAIPSPNSIGTAVAQRCPNAVGNAVAVPVSRPRRTS